MTTTFSTAGPHQVGVQARDDEGLRAVSRESVQVDTLASAPFEISLPAGPVRPGVPATFSAPGAVAWDMDGDGAFDDGVGEAPAHAFGAAGTFAVRARTATGRVAMRTVTVVADAGIAPAVTALDLPPVIRAGLPTRFAAAGIDPEGDPVSLTFDLDGDGVVRRGARGGGRRVRVDVPCFGPDHDRGAGDRSDRARGRPHRGGRADDGRPRAGRASRDRSALVAGQPTPLGADVPAAPRSRGTPMTTAPSTTRRRSRRRPRASTRSGRGSRKAGARPRSLAPSRRGRVPPVAAFSSSDDAPVAGGPVTLTAAATRSRRRRRRRSRGTSTTTAHLTTEPAKPSRPRSRPGTTSSAWRRATRAETSASATRR